MISAFCSRSLRDYAISNLNFRLNRRHTSKQLLGEESRKSSKKGPSPIGEDDPQDFQVSDEGTKQSWGKVWLDEE